MIKLDEYIQQLFTVDWHYDKSDDHQVWNAGKKKMDEVMVLSNTNEYFIEAFKVISEFMLDDPWTRSFTTLCNSLNEIRKKEQSL